MPPMTTLAQALSFWDVRIKARSRRPANTACRPREGQSLRLTADREQDGVGIAMLLLFGSGRLWSQGIPPSLREDQSVP